MTTFPERLKKLRKEKYLTQQELASKVGISRVGYSYWEKGKREPNLDKVKLLAKYLDTSVDYLLGAVEDKQSFHKFVKRLDETNKRMNEICQKSSNNEFLSSNLSRLRENRELTREDVEELLSTRGNYFNWELGISEPNLDDTVALANFFQLSVYALYNRTLYRGNNYEETNTLKDAFLVKVEHKIYHFKDDILDLSYEFGYKYTDIQVSEKGLVSALDYSSIELDSMKEDLDGQLAPLKEDMIKTYQREEEVLKRSIEDLQKQMSEENYSTFLSEQLNSYEEALESRKAQAKKLLYSNDLDKE